MLIEFSTTQENLLLMWIWIFKVKVKKYSEHYLEEGCAI